MRTTISRGVLEPSSKLVGWSSIVDTQKDAVLNGGTKIVLKPVSSCQMSTGWSQDVTITVSNAVFRVPHGLVTLELMASVQRHMVPWLQN